MYRYPGRIGLQAAKIVVREFKRDVIPAFEALIVYYSIASSTESVSPLNERKNGVKNLFQIYTPKSM